MDAISHAGKSVVPATWALADSVALQNDTVNILLDPLLHSIRHAVLKGPRQVIHHMCSVFVSVCNNTITCARLSRTDSRVASIEQSDRRAFCAMLLTKTLLRSGL